MKIQNHDLAASPMSEIILPKLYVTAGIIMYYDAVSVQQEFISTTVTPQSILQVLTSTP